MDVEPSNSTFREAQNNFLSSGSANDFSPASSQPGGAKRKGPQFPELFTAGGKKRKLGGGPVQTKNALVTLNEYKPGLEYVMVDQRGPVHQPVFVIRVTVNGSQFLGEGGAPPTPGTGTVLVPPYHGCSRSLGWGFFDALKGPA